MAFPVSPTEGQTFTEDNTVWIYSAVTGQWNRSVVNPGNSTDYRSGKGYVGSDLTVDGDLTLDDGGTYTTTLQTITPTANRTISLPNATGTVALVAGSSGQLVYNNAGAQAGAPGSVVGATGDVTLGLNGAASTPPLDITGTWFTGGSTITTKPQVLIEPAGTTSTAWSTSGTGLGVNAASGFEGSLLDLQVNGTTACRITKDGDVRAARHSAVDGSVFIAQGSGRTIISDGSGSGGAIELGGGGTAANAITIVRDAADILALRRTTNAQTSRVYGTYTDASNYVRAALSSTSTAVTLAAETAGTGADNIPLNLTAAGTGTVKVNSVAEVVVSSTVAGLPAAPVVGMLTRVTDATAPVVGTTVAGGGAAAALCWYNGANWSVIGV